MKAMHGPSFWAGRQVSPKPPLEDNDTEPVRSPVVERVPCSEVELTVQEAHPVRKE